MFYAPSAAIAVTLILRYLLNQAGVSHLNNPRPHQRGFSLKMRDERVFLHFVHFVCLLQRNIIILNVLLSFVMIELNIVRCLFVWTD